MFFFKKPIKEDEHCQEEEEKFSTSRSEEMRNVISSLRRENAQLKELVTLQVIST